MRYPLVIGVGAILAASISVLATVLTARSEVRSAPFDPVPVEEASEDLQAELDRLYIRFDDKLASLMDLVTTAQRNSFAVESTANRIAGIRTVTRLSTKGSGDDAHFEIRATAEGERPFDRTQFPRPVLAGVEQAESPKGEEVREFSPAQFPESIATGWIRQGEGVFYRWSRPREHSVLVIGVDGQSVVHLSSDWLKTETRLLDEWSNLVGKTDAAAVRILDPGGEAIFEVGRWPDSGGAVLRFPASIRFGTWVIEAVGKTELVVVRDWGWFLAGQVLALVLLIAALSAGVALRRAHRVARQRVSFVNRASHELRTPLTNLMLNTDLARDLLETDPAGAEKRLNRVSGEAARLSRLVDNLLTFSRSDRGEERLHLEPLDPEELLSETLESFDLAFSDRNIAVERERGEFCRVSVDRDALVQVFANLLSNVEKYAEGNPLRIAGQSDGQNWIVDFHDGGAGVPERHRERIFDPFHRAVDRIDEGVTGTGLGLSIARELTNRMNGDLLLESSERGACFRIRLPLIKG